MDVVCDLSIGGRGLGCIGNIAILAGVALAAAGCDSSAAGGDPSAPSA